MVDLLATAYLCTGLGFALCEMLVEVETVERSPIHETAAVAAVIIFAWPAEIVATLIRGRG